jgi:hypothetical protein
MPQGDRTGPNGAGAMTGRRMGFCAGFDSPGYTNSGLGRGKGFGRGRGLGYRRQSNITNEDEKRILEENLKELDLEKKEIERRIKEIR